MAVIFLQRPDLQGAPESSLRAGTTPSHYPLPRDDVFPPHYCALVSCLQSPSVVRQDGSGSHHVPASSCWSLVSGLHLPPQMPAALGPHPMSEGSHPEPQLSYHGASHTTWRLPAAQTDFPPVCPRQSNLQRPTFSSVSLNHVSRAGMYGSL